MRNGVWFWKYYNCNQSYKFEILEFYHIIILFLRIHCKVRVNNLVYFISIACIDHILLSDENNSFTSDFLGFSLYISNTISKEDGILCFKDTIYTVETIPNPLNISCRANGRYVIYYNNRTHLPFPKGYSDYAVFTLCEIEVYGNLMEFFYQDRYVMIHFYKFVLFYRIYITFR